jgi:hypothetical protein
MLKFKNLEKNNEFLRKFTSFHENLTHLSHKAVDIRVNLIYNNFKIY